MATFSTVGINRQLAKSHSGGHEEISYDCQLTAKGFKQRESSSYYYNILRKS